MGGIHKLHSVVRGDGDLADSLCIKYKGGEKSSRLCRQVSSFPFNWTGQEVGVSSYRGWGSGQWATDGGRVVKKSGKKRLCGL